jgi:hypothetical protein
MVERIREEAEEQPSKDQDRSGDESRARPDRGAGARELFGFETLDPATLVPACPVVSPVPPVVPGAAVVAGEQLCLAMVLASKVTDPFRASARPSTFVPVFTVIEVKARMLPLKREVVPSVAELPTCQKTLQAWASPRSTTRLPDAVVTVEPNQKMKTAWGSPWASSVRSPVRPSDDADL